MKKKICNRYSWNKKVYKSITVSQNVTVIYYFLFSSKHIWLTSCSIIWKYSLWGYCKYSVGGMFLWQCVGWDISTKFWFGAFVVHCIGHCLAIIEEKRNYYLIESPPNETNVCNFGLCSVQPSFTHYIY